MSQSSLCRLCVNICNECKSLFDDNGRSNEVYETTVKYFDPMVGILYSNVFFSISNV